MFYVFGKMNYHRKMWFMSSHSAYCVAFCKNKDTVYWTLVLNIHTDTKSKPLISDSCFCDTVLKFHIFNLFCRHIPNVVKRDKALKIFESINFCFQTSSLWIMTARYRFYMCINRMGTLYTKVVTVLVL